jgi:hypothetical protein
LSARDLTAPRELEPGDTLRIDATGRRGTFAIGRGLADHGTLTIRRWGVELVLGEEAFTVVPAGEDWHLELTAAGGSTVARHHGTRRGRGAITFAGDDHELELPRRRRPGRLTAPGGEVRALIEADGETLLVEARARTAPALAAFAATIVLLRSTFREPRPAPARDYGTRYTWEPLAVASWAGESRAGE